ncbi:hypothetical protein BH11PSE3_BH11PSE3_43990 [soil metagenome]
MDYIWAIVAGLGGGLIAAGVIGIGGRSKRRRLAASGDEKAKLQLVKWRTLETVVAPSCLALGLCLLGIKFYADYEKARTPLSPHKAFENATKRLMKRLPTSD